MGIQTWKRCHPEEDIDFGFCNIDLVPDKRLDSPLKFTYEYEEELPTEVTVGSGTPAITLTDTSIDIRKQCPEII